VQRPLWASTSTKDPKYPDLMYVENVVGPDTVNTMPPATLQGLLDHGNIVADTIESNFDEVEHVMRDLNAAGISLAEVTQELQTEGVKLFEDSFTQLIGAIEKKQNQLAVSA
jgi:transaldolase